MKKGQVKILASALYEASRDKKGKELDRVMSNFSDYLSKHHLVSMIPSILAELKTIYFKDNNIVATRIISKQDLDQSEIKKIVDLVKFKTKQEVSVEEEIDASVLGGAVIKYNDKIIDLSIKNQLNNLAKQLNN